METILTTSFDPNNKRSIKLEPTGDIGLRKFLEALDEDEIAALERFKSTEPELCAPWSDPFLMRFLWARKLEVDRATELLKNHLRWREEHQLETHLNPEDVRKHLKDPSTTFTPGNYTRQGYPVAYLRAKDFDLERYKALTMSGVLRVSYFTLDMMADHDIEAARNGRVLVQDFSGASFSVIMSMSKGDDTFNLGKMMDSLQNNLPSRMPGVIMVNAPWWMRFVLAIAKPMMKKKLRKKIHVCSQDELGKYFTPEHLPTFYGGQFEVNTDWVDPVIDARGKLSEGKYVDVSPRSEELIKEYTGGEEALKMSAIVAEAKKSKKKDKKDKKEKIEAEKKDKKDKKEKMEAEKN